MAARLQQIDSYPTYRGGSPPSQPNLPVFFKSFAMPGHGDANHPDAQVYSYPGYDNSGHAVEILFVATACLWLTATVWHVLSIGSEP